MSHYHGTTVALESHTSSGLELLCDKCRFAKQIDCGIAIQEYDLPEVQLIVEILLLVEELCNVSLELSVQCCELESIVCNLKVPMFFLIIVIRKV